MNIHRKLWHWCRRPVKPVSTNFVRLSPVSISILISGLLLTMLVAAVLLVQIPFPSVFRFFSYSEESGRATEVVERVLFPGGALVAYKVPVYDPSATWHIYIAIHNYVACEEDLSAYVNSRTNALNELLLSLSPNEKVQVTVTFKEPLEPAYFKNVYEDYFTESDGPYNCAIIVENETSGKQETIRLNAPSPDYLEQFLTYPKEDLRLVSVISIEACVRVNIVKAVADDSRVLLVDPQKCLTVRALVNKYSLKGFKVFIDGPPLLVRHFTHELTYNLVPLDELLDNPSKYNRWTLYFVGKVSDLDLIEDTFKLDERLLVCYKYYGADLSDQIKAEDIRNGDYAVVIGTFFKERSTLYAEEIEKAMQEYPLTLMVDELLANPQEYDGQMVQVFGRVSNLGTINGPFFKLDGKILVCYAYNDVNLSSQISGVQNGDPMIVTGVFYYNDMIYARNIRPSR